MVGERGEFGVSDQRSSYRFLQEKIMNHLRARRPSEDNNAANKRKQA